MNASGFRTVISGKITYIMPDSGGSSLSITNELIRLRFSTVSPSPFQGYLGRESPSLRKFVLSTGSFETAANLYLLKKALTAVCISRMFK